MSEELEKKENNEPKKRGRPRKNPVVEETESKAKTVKKETEKKVSNEPKKRGRPRKNPVAEETIEKEKVEEKKLTVKKNPKEVTINNEKLEKIEEEIKKQTTIPDEKKKKINKRIFQNIMVAIGIVIYFIFINLGFYNIESAKFLKDLQVFSMVSIGITIIIFEVAYKKDSGELAIYGIEFLILSICTLLTIFVGINYNDKFSYIMNTIAMLFAIYYVGKSIVIYLKMRKKALKRASDIEKIRRVK